MNSGISLYYHHSWPNESLLLIFNSVKHCHRNTQFIAQTKVTTFSVCVHTRTLQNPPFRNTVEQIVTLTHGVVVEKNRRGDIKTKLDHTEVDHITDIKTESQVVVCLTD